MGVVPALPVATPEERFALRETLAAWNRALDDGDVAALTTLTAADADFMYEEVAYAGADALSAFVADRAGAGDIVQRTHVNHVQAWHVDEGFRTRAMAMIVHMRPSSTPFGDGAPTVAWVGYTEDMIRETESGPKVASRRFLRWDGFLRDAPNSNREGKA